MDLDDNSFGGISLDHNCLHAFKTGKSSKDSDSKSFESLSHDKSSSDIQTVETTNNSNHDSFIYFTPKNTVPRPSKSLEISKSIRSSHHIECVNISSKGSYDFINVRDLKHLVNDPFQLIHISRDPSSIKFDFPDSDFICKLHDGRTPFTDRFQDSPIVKSVPFLRMNLSNLCDEFDAPFWKNDLLQSVELSQNKIRQLVSYGTCEKIVEDFVSDDFSTMTKLLFGNFFFLNERCIFLQVIDANQLLGSDFGHVDTKFVSTYNSFHFFVTFCDVVKMKHFGDITLYKAMHRFDSQLYYIKVSRLNPIDIRALDRSSDLLQKEVSILSRLNHEHIVRYYSSWIEYQKLYEQLEYLEDGTLDEFVWDGKSNFHHFLKCPAAIDLTNHISRALDYLHVTSNILHNDVAAHNIFLCKDVRRHRAYLSEELFESNLIFKLAGFERSTIRVDEKCDKHDVQGLAVVVASAIGEQPQMWIELNKMTPPQSIKMQFYHKDKDFTRILIEAVLGYIVSARDLIDRLNCW